MDAEQKQQNRRPKEHRGSESQGKGRSDSDEAPRDRNRNRRSGGHGGGGRRGAYRFDDELEHSMCQLVTHQAPRGFPVTARAGLAVMPPVEIARTEKSVLFCDNRHEGPHLWPNGDEVD